MKRFANRHHLFNLLILAAAISSTMIFADYEGGEAKILESKNKPIHYTVGHSFNIEVKTNNQTGYPRLEVKDPGAILMKKYSHEKVDVPVEGYTKYIYTFVVMKPGDAEILRINRESDTTPPMVEVRYSIIAHEPALRKKAANNRQLANNCNYICVKAGQVLRIEEIFTSCDGYSWKLKDNYDKRVVKLIKDTYTKKSKPSHHGKAFLICDRQCFKFKALRKGMTELILEQEKDLKNGGKSIICKYYTIIVS